MLVEFLLNLDRKPAHIAVVEIAGQRQCFIMFPAGDFVLLSDDVALILGLDLHLIRDLAVRDTRPRTRQGHQRCIVDVGPLQQVHETVVAFDRFAEDPRHIGLGKIPGTDPSEFEPLLLARDGIALAIERFPTHIVDDAEIAADMREPQIGIVLAQHEAVLGAAGKHSIRL